jgi:hypothetical protein
MCNWVILIVEHENIYFPTSGTDQVNSQNKNKN